MPSSSALSIQWMCWENRFIAPSSKPEIRMPKPERNPKSETRIETLALDGAFLRSSVFAFRSDFYMNQPTPDPSQEGSRQSSVSCQLPSWEGSGVGSWSQCMREANGGCP